jgi:hypothetical protein
LRSANSSSRCAQPDRRPSRWLRRFPFDKIKIDRCFVTDVAKPGGSSSIVQAVVSIAAARNMTTTAHGVETRQQLETLRTLGCAEIPDYLFSPARPASEVRQLICARRKRAAAVAWSVASAKLNGVILILHACCFGSQQGSEPFRLGRVLINRA